MKDVELNIRIADVSELPDSHVNRWELLRFNGENLAVTLTSRFGIDAETHQVELRVYALYRYMRGMVTRPLLDVGCAVRVELNPFPIEFVVGDEQLPPRLMTIMYGAAVGALRGMIAMRVTGTALSAYPLPLVNVSQLVSNHVYGSQAPRHSFPLDELVYN